MSSLTKAFSQPFGVLWRTALVRLPRAVPDVVLYYTSPDGPHPFVVNLPSRGEHEIPVYVFLPPSIHDDPLRPQSVPTVIDFHGGGFVLGSCLEQAPFCAQLSRELGAIVLSVDYRLGPVDKFPAAVEDAEDVLYAVLDERKPGYQELREAITQKLIDSSGAKNKSANPTSAPVPSSEGINLDTSKIAISGFSSGGNLALELALDIAPNPPLVPRAWPCCFPPDHAHPIPLLLFYPSLDSRLLPSKRTRPPGLPIRGGFWGELMDTLVPTYLSREEAAHPRASPGLADIRDGGLHEQARMLLVLPELDTLNEQSERWVEKVKENGRGRHLRVERYKGMKHGWTQMPVSFLEPEEKRTRTEVFEIARDFVKTVWEKGDVA